MILSEALRVSASRFPEKIFLYCGQNEVTYSQANFQVGCLASNLARLGVRKGDRVAIFCENSIEMVLSLIAVSKASAIAAFIDARCGDKFARYVSIIESSALILSSSTRETVKKNEDSLPETTQLICIRAENYGIPFLKLLEETSGSTPQSVDESSPFHLSFTSGSTGDPKGVLLAHEPTIRATSCIAERLGITWRDTTLCPTTLSSSFHLVANLLPGMLRGATVGIMERWTPSEAVRVIEERHVTVFVGNPLILSELHSALEETSRSRGSLRMVLSGGGPAPPRLKAQFRENLCVPFVESYGQSELGGFVALGYSTLNLQGDNAVGPPLPDKEVKIADENGMEVSVGEIGEIILRGGFMVGYWRSPEATVHVLRNGWLHTGDLGRMDREGNIQVMGRAKEAIRSKLGVIFPREVEEAVLTHPAVKSAAVLGAAVDCGVEVPKAYVTLRHGVSVTAEELLVYLRELADRGGLPKVAVPGEIEILSEMPMTPTGKIDKVGLRKRQIILRLMDRTEVVAATVSA